VGAFTRQLGRELNAAMETANNNDTAAAAASDASLPITFPAIYLDGFHGSPNRIQQAFQHDVVVLVAGGIGITPYLSLLPNLLQQASNTHNHHHYLLKKVVLHWNCRDPALISYVKREYLDPLLLLATELNHGDSTTRFRIIIHNTARGSNNLPSTLGDSGSTRSYSDMENPQEDNTHHDEQHSSLYSIPTQHQTGTPFSPSRFGSKSTIRGNAASFLSFFLTASGGLAGILYCYFHWQSKTTTLPRLGGPVIVVVWSAAVAWFVHYFVLWDRDDACAPAEFEPIVASMDKEDIDADNNDDEDYTESTVELGEVTSLSLRSPAHDEPVDGVHQSSLSNDKDNDDVVTLEERPGRASVHQFLNSLEQARRPGLFVCGPAPLLQKLRAATHERCLLRLQRCATAGEPPIAVYEETFEL